MVAAVTATRSRLTGGNYLPEVRGPTAGERRKTALRMQDRRRQVFNNVMRKIGLFINISIQPTFYIEQND